MPFHVEMAERAVVELEELYIEKNAFESRTAARWYNRLEEAIAALTTSPHGFPLISEARSIKRELRHLLYGTNRTLTG